MINISTTQAHQLSVLFGKAGVLGSSVTDNYRKSTPFEPIQYTSLTGFMVLNYVLLAGLLALPIAIANLIIEAL